MLITFDHLNCFSVKQAFHLNRHLNVPASNSHQGVQSAAKPTMVTWLSPNCSLARFTLEWPRVLNVKTQVCKHSQTCAFDAFPYSSASSPRSTRVVKTRNPNKIFLALEDLRWAIALLISVPNLLYLTYQNAKTPDRRYWASDHTSRVSWQTRYHLNGSKHSNLTTIGFQGPVGGKIFLKKI